MTPEQLRRRISRLPERAPLTTRFEGNLAERVNRCEDPWRGSHQEHWLSWLKDYRGPGSYGRKRWDGIPVETVFNRVVNPALVLWLAEAAGLSTRDVKRAAAAALAGGTTMMQQSAAIRSVISWKMIEERLR